jgi:hypothetical protein
MTWNSTPQRARWYGEVIYEDSDGETTYAYAYSASREEPDAELILPAKMRDQIIESTVKPTPRNETYVSSSEEA